MLVFLRRRFVYSLMALVGVLIAVFGLSQLNGSPASLYLPEGATPEMVSKFNAIYGFDRPVWIQFYKFLIHILHFDFGQSISQSRPAREAILSVLGPTVELAGMALFFSVLVAVFLGTVAALRPFSRTDKAITYWSLLINSIPDFWYALILVLVFAVQLHVLPTSGQDAGWKSWVLPIATLMLSAGGLTQVVRGAMIEALNSSYVQNARARGYGRYRLAIRHALRNAALPIVTIIGDRAVHMFNGTVIVNAVFAWVGVGGTMVAAVNARDFAVLQAGVFIIGVIIISLNLFIDIIYAVIDPRIRIA